MRARTLRSSLIRRIVFYEAGTLLVSFRSALRYIYDGLPRALYEALGRAALAGRYFNEHVKGRYACRPDTTGRCKHRPVVEERRAAAKPRRRSSARAEPGRASSSGAQRRCARASGACARQDSNLRPRA